MDIRVTDRTSHQDHRFRIPQDLRLTPPKPLNLMILGSCLGVGLANQFTKLGHSAKMAPISFVDRYPDITPEEAASYDFQIVQIPIRVIYSEQAYLKHSYDNPDAFAELMELSKTMLRQILLNALQYNEQHGILTFVCNFIAPQQNYLGRLLPRYDLRNPVYYVEQLNEYLYDLLRERRDVYLMDIDQVSATYGRMYHQDDHVWAVSHGAILGEYDYAIDQNRIEPTQPMSLMYAMREHEFMHAVCVEAEGLYRTCRQIDQVKMVVVDLDDTLWRGVIAEDGQFGTIEGWPMGFTEALVFLKERGVVLAIISKNDEATIAARWDEHFKGMLSLDAFAIRKINWNAKPDNMADVLAQANLLPRSVVFVDDNPRERAAMAEAYPDMRILGADLYYLRRILLWAPETQTAVITAEARGRAQTIQASAARAAERSTLSREDFLAALALKVTPLRIAAPDHPSLPRALELLNRTNQFNTTGRRWTAPELDALFAGGGVLYAFEVEDRHARYGLTGVAVVSGAVIDQFVMSCRVLGLDAELAMLSLVCQDLKAGGVDQVFAVAQDTELNLLSRDLYARAGFELVDEQWRKSLTGFESIVIPALPPAPPPTPEPAKQADRPSPPSLGEQAKALYRRLRRPEATLVERIDHLKARLSRPR